MPELHKAAIAHKNIHIDGDLQKNYYFCNKLIMTNIQF